MSAVEYPRQGEPTLNAALSEAVRMMRAQSLSYRNPNDPRRIDKKARRSLAATYDDWARIIEKHLSAFDQEGGAG